MKVAKPVESEESEESHRSTQNYSISLHSEFILLYARLASEEGSFTNISSFCYRSHARCKPSTHSRGSALKLYFSGR